MIERESILNDYYSNYDEDNRLIKNNAHQVEFITTTKYIDKYLKKGDKILEIGAGTGRYSLYYADKGYDVTAIEYVQSNVDKLKSKIKDTMNIRAEQGDALDLSRFNDNAFDITLIFGPLYHLYTEEDIRKAIDEAIRVTKKDGYIYLAYLTNDAVFLTYFVKRHHLYDKDSYDKNYKLYNKPEKVFSVFYIEEFKNIMKDYNIEYVSNVATDGISSILRDYINELNEDEFNVWIDYHLSTCEREDLQGYSNHMLYICKKK